MEELGDVAGGSGAVLKLCELRGELYLIDGYEAVIEPEDQEWINGSQV